MNFSLSSVLKSASALGAALLLGCGSNDGRKELEAGQSAYELRDLKRAEKLFGESLACAPQDVDRILYLARVKLDLGELAAARDLVTQAASLADGDADVAMLESQIAWHAKDYKTAAEGFSALAGNAQLSADIRSQALAGLGVVEMTCNNPHLARVAFLRAIRLNRRNAAAWYHLGLLYRDGFGYLETALEQFEIFVRLEASASPRVQKVQRAIIPALKESVSRALSERPGASKRDSAACAKALAKAQTAWKKESYKVARQAYQEAFQADPLSYPAALGLAKAWTKTDATKAGQGKALDAYKSACLLRPSAVSTFLETGALASKLGFSAQAVEVYSRAVAASPTSLEALDGLIRTLRKVGNRASVAKAYQDYRDSLAQAKTAKKR